MEFRNAGNEVHEKIRSFLWRNGRIYVCKLVSCKVIEVTLNQDDRGTLITGTGG